MNMLYKNHLLLSRQQGWESTIVI